MKKLIITMIVMLFGIYHIQAQTVTPTVKAKFGVEGEVNSGYRNNIIQNVQDSHDWFARYNDRAYRWVIDTSGAAFITTRYNTDLNFRKIPFFRTMQYDPFQIVDGRTLIDAVFIRDYHGADSTVYAMSNKNGDSPADWIGAIEASVPQKNDILDIFVHVRRNGANTYHTVSDSLFFFGGIAIDATSGSRYFDFELYQTDIFYDRATTKFSGFGPDAGHTSWKFDPVTGVVTTPGDVIFSAEFGGSGLQDLVAKVWVHKDALLINSPNFNWTGEFDGAAAGATYGYAGIMPKNGNYFYTGIQNAAASWAGPFKLVRKDNTVQTDFDANQFLEFSVNMGTLGLDPINLLGGSQCDMPFRRILVKTRASSSFTAELKDFVGPFDFFEFKAADAFADIPMICGDEMISTISVLNPLPTSTYTWVTPDGNIVGDTFGYTIRVDTPGTYIVRQQLLAGCGEYAADTVVILESPDCGILPINRIDLKAALKGQLAKLEFNVSANENVSYYVIERSTDGTNFSAVKTLNSNSQEGFVNYLADDNLNSVNGNTVYYRIRVVRVDGSIRYSSIVQVERGLNRSAGFTILPNPVKDRMQLQVLSGKNDFAYVKIFSVNGALMLMQKVSVVPGNNLISFDDFRGWSSGTYVVQVHLSDEVFTEKMILTHKK
ncbi:T9SS type A sorting domain-containing protein [Flavihumibacter stibioxidans]|uniref:Secretion system C-terminal sorting domain-containing protein n=1 Tax=Flavihumibacter stibioxidans TaxID=1834163 RepID=A0ABR7MC33_9BACT|nr:T9SS type A sorting domain-containing protein [Flavihumibacter stibioxidans]MBC6492389.1 hypothetical protein [Flavihumibacter stibioxidans]